MEKPREEVEVALYFAKGTKQFGYSIPLNGMHFLTCFNNDLGALVRGLEQDLEDTHRQATLVSKVPGYLAGNGDFRPLYPNEMAAAQIEREDIIDARSQ